MAARSKIRVSFLLLLSLGAWSGAQAAGEPSAPNARPASIDFGSHDVGTRTEQVTVRVDNPTSVELQLTPWTNAPDYAVERNGCREPVAPGSWCTVAVSFSPVSGAGGGGEARLGVLFIGYPSGADGKTPSRLAVTLTGKGFIPELGVSPARLLFPRSGPASVRQMVVLTNNSHRDLKIQGAFVTGDFAVAAPATPQWLKPGSVLVLPVRRTGRGGAASGALTILSDASVNPQTVALATADPVYTGFLCANRALGDFLLAFALCLAYWLGMVVVRWQRVAMDTRAGLRGEIHAVQAQLDMLAAAGGSRAPGAGSAVAALLREAGDLLDGPKDRSGNRWLNILFWSRGQEIAGWGCVHEAKVRMVPLLDDETVRARLAVAEQGLRLAGDARSTAVADAIHNALTANPAEKDRLPALLAQALTMSYSQEDGQFAELVNWQNKAAWLVGCGLCAILALTAVFPQHAILLLVGAVGGLISRLTRALDRTSVPTDYGASWTTLFLSPVAGAVGAWAGILISNLAVEAQILGSMFHGDWANPGRPATLSIALLLGFSERLLDNIFDKLAGNATGANAAQATAPKPGLAIATSTLPDAQAGKPYAPPQLQATSATGDVKWSLAPGSALPDGLTLDPSGQISGTPATAGTFTFTIAVTDQKPDTSTRDFTLIVKP